ncbi:hypothetical protein K435DRAFT_833642 [Dendrothele bispora CBS 962.96]|uniref:Oxidoreductase-like domain-containing protein n=1 Tax=Dendrothele bispora (strain CBS 962.96) TaxID=1314807 RepID=A0A4S8MVH1_DENBC|nr:hypothetical protein K435DRAFT_833642 [Dendrothele bispora CBS 962.96]
MPLINAILRTSVKSRHTLTPIRFLSFKHRKKPSRGGQNLSERYKRLEKSLRGKEAYAFDADVLKQPTLTGPASGKPTKPGSSSTAQLFQGLTIPEKPEEPADDECCMSGCAVCVYDLYEESLGLYKEALAKVTATLTSMGVPESEWPASLRSSAAGLEVGKKKDVALSAFEEMERRLAEKSAAAGGPEASPKDQGQSPVGHEERSRVVKMHRRRNAWNVSEVYEGLRWVFFPNR